ncbi:hypothetical protein PVW46_17045 [Mameliella sp. AT18]|uniref:DUF6950 family protein n=1 Tax=Mameliella sp. AT18 TaxID=3028385 RepID=UPI0008411FBF|nr:hypothetical protein [Mameliella sp. AT18]MDD9731612.1 hypothetical protein [Mameliella sp. AT18]ODM46182.1 hypothetical protein A9320_26650 [Ruegeria sp. PBVC088]
MTRLQLFIQGWLAEPARWGVSDCCLSALDWAGQVRGLDLTEDLRLTYEDAAQAQRVTRFFTQPLRIAREYLEIRAGCAPTQDPVRGDVALFKLWHPGRGQPLPVAGICIEPGNFVCRGGQEDGARIHSARPERLMGAWEVGYVEG